MGHHDRERSSRAANGSEARVRTNVRAEVEALAVTAGVGYQLTAMLLRRTRWTHRAPPISRVLTVRPSRRAQWGLIIVLVVHFELMRWDERREQLGQGRHAQMAAHPGMGVTQGWVPMSARFGLLHRASDTGTSHAGSRRDGR